MNFNGFAGNEKIKQQLIYLAETGRLPHAIVLEGEEGLGKRTLARELALNLFCTASENKPCRSCPQCVKVLKGIHPDIYEFTATGAVNSFPVAEVRNIVEDAVIRPNEADYKIYILGNCHSMSDYAQNALLKVLEEPPSYAVFILTVENKSALLETVLSRSVVISLQGVTAKEGAAYITSHNEEIDYDDAYTALEIWGGNIGKALESLTDGKLSKISGAVGDVASALLMDNEYELIKACTVFSGDRDMIIASMARLKSVFRDALFYESGELVSGFQDTAKKLSSRLSKEMLCNLIDSCERLKALAAGYANNNLLITKIPYELRRSIGK